MIKLVKLIVTVKIKPWLKEFLICRYGNPSIASRRNIIGALIAPLIEYTPKDYSPIEIDEKECLNIDIPRDLSHKVKRSDLGNIYVSVENQIQFEASVSVIFKEQLFFYMDDKIRYNGQNNERSSNIKDCIYQFCIDNHISFNSIQYENLKKMYYRYRKNGKNDKNNGRRMSLTCPLIFL